MSEENVKTNREDFKPYDRYEPLFGAWYFKRLLGVGGFGRVYEIERKEWDKTYKSALKIISIPQDESDIRKLRMSGTDDLAISRYYTDLTKSFSNEYALMSEFRGNSHIVSYEDHQLIPHDDGIGYDILIRMELLTPLMDYLAKNPMTENDVIRLGCDLCDALSLCHDRGLLHRDIKPDNIFVSNSGDFKIGDFGIARIAEGTYNDLSRKGTFTYMAPEVYRGETYGKQADIYSLGIVLYYLTNSNRAPFFPNYPDPITVEVTEKAFQIRMQGEVVPRPAMASPRLGAVITKACAPEPGDRFASAREMGVALRRLLGTGGPPLPSTPVIGALGRTAGGMQRQSTGGMQRQSTGGMQRPSAGGMRRGTAGGMQRQSTGGMQRQSTGGMQRPTTGGYNMTVPLRTPTSGGSVSGRRRRKKSKSWIALVALAVVLAGASAGVFFSLRTSDNAAESNWWTAGDIGKTAETVSAEGIRILDSDWDWDDSGTVDDDHEVDIILLVKNDSDDAVTGMLFDISLKKGSNVINAASHGEPFVAYGYIPAEEKGVMVARVQVTEEDIRPKDVEYSVKDALCNPNIASDYRVPEGRFKKPWGPENDYYDVILSNSNSVEVNKGSIIAAVELNKNNSKKLAGDNPTDAGGSLEYDLEPDTRDYSQSKAFNNPTLNNEKYYDYSIYVLDVDYYRNARQ